MTTVSPKGSSIVASYPRTLSSIAASVCGLAAFLVLASLLLVSRPIGSTVHGYFYGVDNLKKFDSTSWGDKVIDGTVREDSRNQITSRFQDSGSGADDSSVRPNMTTPQESESVSQVRHNSSSDVVDREQPSISHDKDDVQSLSGEEALSSSSPSFGSATKELVDDQGENIAENSATSNVTNGVQNAVVPDISLHNSTDLMQPESIAPSSYSVPNVMSDNVPVDPGCDLFHGKWVYDSTGPLYTNNSCPILTQLQNCQGNGRPDKDYENWRWKPAKCDLPRFDAKKFLELMRGKTLAFIGDSVARNQMESLMCILWQVEVPKNRGNKKMQRFYFRSTSTMIVRIWSSWLVHQTSQPFDFAPEGVVKLHLDAPDESFLQFIPSFDVVVLSSGHWFAKQSVYILNNEIVGGQLWRADKSRTMKVNNIEAFGISVETILSAMVTHPNYTGLTILRSFSPDHYEGGAWNTGGSCTGKTRPALDGELVENGFTNIMHEKQVMGFNHAIRKATNKSRLKLMDITEVFSYRHDGHPGPYRNPDPNKITKRRPDGTPPPQDCLHWCMPGPVDTWNEMVLEIIRREFEGN